MQTQPIDLPRVIGRRAERVKPPPVRAAASSASKLRDRMRDQLQLEGKSRNTFEAYWHWCAGLIRFHGLKHPQDLGAAEIEAYLNHLVNVRQLSKSTHGQALHGIRYMYRRVLGLDLQWLDGLCTPKPSKRLPVVLSEAEIQRLWPHLLQGTCGLILRLMYGTGLRPMEALRLRVHDLDLSQMQITVRQGKGDKDRITMVPESMRDELQQRLDMRARWHADDLVCGMAGVEALDVQARMQARQMVVDTFSRLVVYRRGMQPDDGAGAIDVLLVARGGTVRMLRIDKTGGWVAGEEAAVPA